MSTAPMPKRGELWLIDFDPPVGAEMAKIRPAVIVSEDHIGRLPLRLVVPITDWKPLYGGYSWFVMIPADASNGLTKDSGADAFQIKSVSLRRLVRRLGELNPNQLEEVASDIKICVGAS
jgi:mRNA interferase MazF